MQSVLLNVLLLSFYELGRQPFGVSSLVALLKREGFSTNCSDCALDPLPSEQIRSANVIACYVPMHTATRLAISAIPTLQKLNPNAHICFYGLYAKVNEDFLRSLGVHSVISGEFESQVVDLCKSLHKKNEEQINLSEPQYWNTSLERQQFVMPDRSQLPLLNRYAKMYIGKEARITGYIEASRGCKHKCRHCPVVPIYKGKFRIVDPDIVLADIRQQVKMGAMHITFGDPDFFNGPKHALAIIEKLHQEFPKLTYDVTIKVSHILQQQKHLEKLKVTGCILITCAVESFDSEILQFFDKKHTFDNFLEVLSLTHQSGIALNPTFVAFHPWLTLESYLNFLSTISELKLIDNVSPVQYGIRLLVPNDSQLLELAEMQAHIRGFDKEQLSYIWEYRDSNLDLLQKKVMTIINQGTTKNLSRKEIFTQIWDVANNFSKEKQLYPETLMSYRKTEIPYLSEPWYC